MTTARRCGILAALFVLAAPAFAAGADEDDRPVGLSIVEKELSATPATLEKGVEVTVVNDTAEPLSGRMLISDLGLRTKADEALATAGAIQFPGRPFEVPAGGERTIRLRARGLDLKEGTYSGRLSVFEQKRGSVARVPFELAVAGAGVKPAVKEVKDELQIHDLGSDRIQVPLDVAKGAPKLTKGAAVGILSGDEGGVATVTVAEETPTAVTEGVAEAPLTLKGLGEAGKYTGTVDFTPDEKGGAVKLSVDVDWWILWAIVPLGIGLAFALVLRHLKGVGRPGLATVVDQAQVEEEADAAQAAFAKASKGRPWARYDASEAFKAEAKDLQGDIDELTGRSVDKIDPVELKALKKRLRRLETHARTLTKLSGALQVLSDQLDKVSELPPVDGIPAPAPPLFVSGAEKALLTGRKITSLDELDALTTGTAAATKLATSWPALHAQVARAAQRIEAAEQRARGDADADAFVDEARRKLAGAWTMLSEAPDAAAVKEGRLLERLAEAVQLAAETLGIRAERAPAPAPAAFGSPADRALAGEHAGDAVRQEGVELEAASPVLAGLSDEPSASRRRQLALERIRLIDWLQIGFAALAAMYTGLEALYFGETFGGAGDIAKALLWGIVTAGAIDAIIGALRTRLAPIVGSTP